MSFLSISASRALLLLLTTSSLLFFVSVSAARVPLGAGDLDALSSNDTLAADEGLELDDTDHLDDDQLATALGETEPAQSFTCPNNEAYRKTKRGCICRKGYGTFVHGWKRGPSNPQAKRYPSIFPSDCRYHQPGTNTNLFFPKKQGRCFCFTCPTYARTRYVSPGRGFLNSYGSGCYPYRYFYARVRIDGTTCEAIADNPALNTQIQATITKVFRAKFLTYNNTFSPVANAFTCTTGVNGGAFVGFRLGYLGPFAAAQTQIIRGILRNICRFTTLCRELEPILPPGSSLNPIGEAGPKPLDPVEPTPSPPVPSVSPDPTIGRLCSDGGVCATGIINDADCGQGAAATGIRQTAADCVEFCVQRTDGSATFALFGASGQCKCYRGGCDIMAGSFTIYRFDTVEQSPSPGVSPTPQSPSPSTPNPQSPSPPSPNPQSPTPSPPTSPSPNTPSPSPGGQSPAPTSPSPTPTPAPPSVCAAQPFSNGVQCARLVSEDSDCSQNALDALADINLLTSLGLSVGVLNTITLTTCVTVLCPALALGNPSYALYAPETLGLGVGLRCKCYSAATVPRGACTQRAGSYDVYQYDAATTPSPSPPPTPGNSPSPAVPVSPSTPPTSPSTPPTPTPATPQVCAAAPLTNGVQCADLVREDSDCSQGALDPLLNLGILASLGLSVDALNTLTLTTCVTVLCPALALGNPSYALYAPETLGLGVGLRCKCFSEAAVPRGSCSAISGAYDVYQYEAVPTPTPTPTPPTPTPSPSPSLPPTPEPTPSPPAATAVKVRSNSDCVEAIVDLTTLPTLPIALTEEDCVYRTCAGVPGRTYALWNSLGLLVCKCYRTTTCSPGLLSLGFEVWRYTN